MTAEDESLDEAVRQSGLEWRRLGQKLRSTTPAGLARFLLIVGSLATVIWLLVAWRWELVGGILAIATMCLRELAWVLIKGDWFAGFLILWAVVLPPAILFLIAWWLDRGAGASTQA